MIKRSHSPLPPRHSNRRLVLLITSAVLVALIAVGSVVGQRLVDGTSNTSFASTNTIGGAFVQPPLSAAQVYSLHHIVSHMQYKQLASLYVAHMSLDEELGQLIMVEYNDTSYSSDLDTMVNKLHAGGVIMYEFQMQTATQTAHDIGQMQALDGSISVSCPLHVTTINKTGCFLSSSIRRTIWENGGKPVIVSKDAMSAMILMVTTRLASTRHNS